MCRWFASLTLSVSWLFIQFFACVELNSSILLTGCSFQAIRADNDAPFPRFSMNTISVGYVLQTKRSFNCNRFHRDTWFGSSLNMSFTLTLS